jgi:hypothetical protein
MPEAGLVDVMLYDDEEWSAQENDRASMAPHDAADSATSGDPVDRPGSDTSECCP